jgi:hypothetical protein
MEEHYHLGTVHYLAVSNMAFDFMGKDAVPS